MNNLENLYRQVIMDHYKNPRNKGLKGFKKIHYKNPSCGDDITIEANIEEGIIKEVNHQGVGCSICCSSASVLSELVKEKSTDDALRIIDKYYKMLLGEKIEDEEELDEALVYQGVSKFPARIKCATIAFKALEQLIKGEENEEREY
ncbi:MAG: SUF system NifU family Fe-S cluster assembly protein [Bacilli bacterium]|nr:SUF system NifU family Fe-S cluster assembly protein [Bacilli bacterium]